MLIFLSWSGDRSKAIAEAFTSWISQVIQAADSWISRDIAKGERWGPEVSDRLINDLRRRLGAPHCCGRHVHGQSESILGRQPLTPPRFSQSCIRGLDVRTVDVGEFAKAEGGVTCCSLIFPADAITPTMGAV